MPPTPGRQFQQMMAAREEHAHAGSGDVNPLMSNTFGTQQAVTGWRVRHKGDNTPQPIRNDNFGTLMFKESQEFQPVASYSGKSEKQDK